MNAAKINGDTPAHPVDCVWTDSGIPVHGAQTDNAQGWATGLTKREMFAAMAMQGLLAHHGDDEYDYRALARCAVWRANALLSELAKEGES